MIDNDLARELLTDMVRVRLMEEKCAELYSAMKIRGFLHLYVGEEAVAAGSLHVLEDAGTFTIYNPSFTIREDVAEDYPEVADLVAQLAPRLTDEVMRELQAQVELEGESARSVARQWLQDEGLAEAPTTTTSEEGD